MGAGSPAKNSTRCMAPAVTVFAAKAAPTGIEPAFEFLDEIAPAVETAQMTTLVVVCLYSTHGRASTARFTPPNP
ncbi:hypothetical protein AL532_00835 [Pseudomonas monteilii]|nr:hypothetical protein AL532_00835 [Pseudomonas monteilii]